MPKVLTILFALLCTAALAQQKGTFTDTRDGKIYKTVKIGEQVWMGENLNYEVSGSYCYNNKTANCTKYGRLYNWETAMKACPSSWHLPSDEEWRVLYYYVYNTNIDTNIHYIRDKFLKARSGWYKNGNGEDKYGFSALPGGGGHSVGGNLYLIDETGFLIGETGFWWSSTEESQTSGLSVYGRGISYDGKIINNNGYRKKDLYSVRCLQDGSASTMPNNPIEPKYPYIRQQRGTFTDTRDGKKYKTTTIDEQVWLAENLNYEAKGSKCYNDSTANCDKYGKLYSWETAMNVCPSGWHLPDKVEWEILNETAGGEKTAGKYLKAVSGWNKNGNGEDKFGFSALPSGHGYSDDSFYNVGYYGSWWSSSEDKKNYAYYRYMYHNLEGTKYGSSNKDDLFSVRCVQGSTKPKGSFTDTRDGKIYKTTKIGTQTWMAENLNYKTSGSKCYNDISAYCYKYGRLYSWATAMGIDAKYNDERWGGSDVIHQGICPSGWHLPSEKEWHTLFRYADGKSGTSSSYSEKRASKFLKATSGWKRKDGISQNGEDKFGFSALPGEQNYSGSNSDCSSCVGYFGFWWSATDGKLFGDDAYFQDIRPYPYYDEIVSYDYDKSNLFSVRCIQNTPTPPTGTAK